MYRVVSASDIIKDEKKEKVTLQKFSTHLYNLPLACGAYRHMTVNTQLRVHVYAFNDGSG
jgi:hypothetical protein